MKKNISVFILIIVLLVSTIPQLSYAENQDIKNLRVGDYTALSDGTRTRVNADSGTEGTFYYVVLPYDGTTPPTTPTGIQIKGGLNASGSVVAEDLKGQIIAEWADKSDSNGSALDVVLEWEAHYKVFAVIQDDSSNYNSVAELDFTVPSRPDTGGPVITSVTYNGVELSSNETSDLAIDGNIIITFDEPIRNIDDSDITASNISSIVTVTELALGVDTKGDTVPYVTTINMDKTIITIDPDSNLWFDQRYIVEVADVEDEHDNVILLNGENRSTKFNTINDESDSIAPSLVSNSPSDGKADVALDSNLTITFEEPVFAGPTYDLGYISISNGGDDYIQIAANDPAITGWGTTTITINPPRNLKPNTTYSMYATNGNGGVFCRDASNNSCTNSLDSWNFTTQDGAYMVWQNDPYFLESDNNDGSISDVQEVTAILTDGTFESSLTTSDYIVSNVPVGLTASLVRTSDTAIELVLSGQATNHGTGDNVDNISIEILSSALSTSEPIGNNVKSDIEIRYSDPVTLYIDKADFVETAANNGEVQDVRTYPDPIYVGISSNSGEFIDTVLKNQVTINNLPVGLDYAVSKISSTVLKIDISGAATNHADENDVTNATVTISADAIVGTSVPLTTPEGDYITFDFNDPGTYTVINQSAIAGVTAPVAGETPVSAVTETDQYTGTVTWSESPDTFGYGTVYTATITLTAKDGYTLTGVDADFFTVEGATATNSADTGVVTAVFPVTQEAVYESTATLANTTKSVAYGTTEANAIAALDTTVGVVGSSSENGTATISWTIASYSATTPGDYTATGVLTLPTGWTGSADDVTATVTVQAAPSSSGSSSSSVPDAETEDEVVNDSTDGDTTITSTTIDSETDSSTGSTVAEISSEITTELVEKAISVEEVGKKSVVEIIVESSEATVKTEISISKDDFDQISSKTDASVLLQSDVASIEFDSAAVETISEATGTGDVSIKMEKVEASALDDAIKQVVADRPVYDFSVNVGDESVSDFAGGKANIAVPYTLQEGEKPEAVVIYFVNDDGSLTTISGKYNVETGKVEFELEHFSKYLIGYNEVQFEDVHEGDWYFNAVNFISARQITIGIGENKFAPMDTLSRAQFLVMIMRAYGIEADEVIASNFSDAGDTYYSGYLAAAKRLGISYGIGDNMFGPELSISRQDMFTLYYRTMVILDNFVANSEAASLENFGDFDQVSDYAVESIEKLFSEGIISGMDGNLAPLNYSTRAQIAQMIYNQLK